MAAAALAGDCAAGPPDLRARNAPDQTENRACAIPAPGASLSQNLADVLDGIVKIRQFSESVHVESSKLHSPKLPTSLPASPSRILPPGDTEEATNTSASGILDGLQYQSLKLSINAIPSDPAWFARPYSAERGDFDGFVSPKSSPRLVSSQDPSPTRPEIQDAEPSSGVAGGCSDGSAPPLRTVSSGTTTFGDKVDLSSKLLAKQAEISALTLKMGQLSVEKNAMLVRMQSDLQTSESLRLAAEMNLARSQSDALAWQNRAIVLESQLFEMQDKLSHLDSQVQAQSKSIQELRQSNQAPKGVLQQVLPLVSALLLIFWIFSGSLQELYDSMRFQYGGI